MADVRTKPDFHITTMGSLGGLSLHTTNDESYTSGLPRLSYNRHGRSMVILIGHNKVRKSMITVSCKDFHIKKRIIKMLESISNKIEWFSRKEGEITSFLVYPLLFIVLYEVFIRYVFNAPTTWGFEATTFLYGLHYMFGYAYTDVHNAHVKVDIFTSYMSRKWQSVIGIATNLLFFMPVMFFMTIWAFKFAYTSTMGLELNSTSWAPPIWPLKILMACCFLFLFLQGIANLIKDINKLSKQ